MVFRVGPRGLLPAGDALGEAQRLDLQEAVRRLQSTDAEQRDDARRAAADPVRDRAGDHVGRLGRARLGRRRARAGAPAHDDRDDAADLARQPARAAGARRSRRRAQAPRGHDRRSARTAGGGVRGAAALRRQRLARAAHAAGDDAHVARRRDGQARAGPGPEAALGDKLREGLDQADRLLEGFLVLSRAQHGELGDQAAVSLAALAAAAVEARGDEIAAQGLDVRVTAPATRACAAARRCSRSSSPTSSTTPCGHNVAGGWLSVAARAEGDVATLVVESGGPRLDAAPRAGADAAVPAARPPTAPARAPSAASAWASRSSPRSRAPTAARVALDAREEGGLRVTVQLPLAQRAPACRRRVPRDEGARRRGRPALGGRHRRGAARPGDGGRRRVRRARRRGQDRAGAVRRDRARPRPARACTATSCAGW